MKVLSWIDQQIQWVKGFLSEGDKASSKRLIALVVTLAFIISYTRSSLNSPTIQDIPINWVMLIAAILGLGIWSNKIEKDNKNADK